jgi:hypothetical protein
MHKATESISSPDRLIGRWRSRGLGRGWRTTVECPVRALAVVMLNEDAQDLVEVARSEDQQPVQALRAGSADEPLGVCVRLGRPRSLGGASRQGEGRSKEVASTGLLSNPD